MFRYATSSVKARIHVLKSEPRGIKSSFLHLLSARCESTSNGSWTGAKVSFNGTSLPDILNAAAAATTNPTTTETASRVLSSLNSNVSAIFSPPSQAMVDWVTNLGEKLVNFFLTPAPDNFHIQMLTHTLASNGVPTLVSMGLGLADKTLRGIVQHCLEYLHCDIGLPWWGAIVAGTVVARLMLLNLTICSKRDESRRIVELKYYLDQIQALELKMKEAEKTYNILFVAKYSKHLMELQMRAENIPILWTQILIFLSQVPIFRTAFFGLQEMTNLPVESMKTGGMLWFTDLTTADPYYILPLITCTTLFVRLEMNKDNVRMAMKKVGHIPNYALRAIPVIIFPFVMNFSAAFLCFWSTTNVMSIGQEFFLRNPSVRRRLGIAQVYKEESITYIELCKRSSRFVKDSFDIIEVTSTWDTWGNIWSTF